MGGVSKVLSYVLSRASFVGAHLIFAYWLNFILNDPLHLGLTNTLDARVVLPADKCTSLDRNNLLWDIGLFAAWWLQHSIMARKAYKQALGLWQHPIERPIYAAAACVFWFATLHFWRPISNCQRFDVFAVPLWHWAISGTVIAAGAVLIVGLLWSLPDHVFGTGKYHYEKGHLPHSVDIIRRFPYELVRHPAASGFLWIYWSLPSYTPNHLLLAALWTAFILVGTLVLEEGGLRSQDEFGRKYEAYAKEVPALYPNIAYLASFFRRGSAHGANGGVGQAKKTAAAGVRKSPARAASSPKRSPVSAK